jgi:uncharacterized membrane protein YhaH (DUF805 family)
MSILSPLGRVGRLEFLGAQILSWFVPGIVTILGALVLSINLKGLVEGIEYGLRHYGPLQVIVDIAQYLPAYTVLIIIGLFGGGYISWVADIKRLHDMGHSGWLSLIRLSSAIPIVGWIIVILYALFLLFTPGQPYDNQYGKASGAAYAQAPRPASTPASGPSPQVDAAMEKLRMRLASGEISVDEFTELAKLLTE